jgi:hypothetical protein
MAPKTGTFDISSRWAFAGEQSVACVVRHRQHRSILAADNEAYNAQVDDFLSDFTTTTTDRQVLAGSSIGGNMVELDEYGRPPTQKDIPGYLVGVPLRKFGFATGWTQDYLDNATPADLAIKQQAAQARISVGRATRSRPRSSTRPTSRSTITWSTTCRSR